MLVTVTVTVPTVAPESVVRELLSELVSQSSAVLAAVDIGALAYALPCFLLKAVEAVATRIVITGRNRISMMLVNCVGVWS